MDIEKKCESCAKVFVVPHWRKATAKTCSPECAGVATAKKYAAARVTKVCRACGKEFRVPVGQAPRRICCSRKCADSTAPYNGPKGDTHHAWKGGQTTHAEGYRYLRVPGHPFGTINTAGYVFEHRVVMESAMRAMVPKHPFLVEIEGELYLRPGIEVHHINESKRDNRLLNLLACTPMGHRAIHNGKAPMRGEVWPEIEGLLPYEPRRVKCKCLVCSAEFVAKRSQVKRGGGKYCTRKCYDERTRVPFSVTLSSA